MALSEEDEARELAFLLAQTPPPKVQSGSSGLVPQSPSTGLAPSPYLSLELFPVPKTPVPKTPVPKKPVPKTPDPSPVVMTRCSPIVMTRRSPVAPPDLLLSDEAAFWVVTSGANPGVYHGKQVLFFFKKRKIY
jgi:hypothetical protein